MNWLKLHNSFPKTPENSINPGQIWMVPVTPEIGKPLRVIEGLKPGIKRLVLSNGVAVRRAENMGGGHQALSPDRELLLEAFQKTSTMSVRSRKTGEVWHLGNFPYLDHPEWVWHRDFGTMRGDLRPLPLFFFDTRHGSMWPIVSMNYHDYGERLQSHRQKRGDATIFFPGTGNQSGRNQSRVRLADAVRQPKIKGRRLLRHRPLSAAAVRCAFSIASAGPR